VCEPNQAALCIVQDGVASHECHNPPVTSNAKRVVNWALTRVTGKHHLDHQFVRDSSLQMLLGGNFQRDTGELVTFAFPESVMHAIQTLMLVVESDEESSSSSQSS